MNILRVIYDFPPPWDGLAPFPFELSLAEAKLGHKVYIICAKWPKAKPELPEMGGNIKFYYIPREPFSSAIFFSSSVIAFFRIFQILLTKKIDIIKLHGHLGIWFYSALLLIKRLIKQKIIVFFHISAKGREIALKYEKQPFIKKFIEWPLHKLSDAMAAKVADRIFVTGENVKEDIIKFHNADREKVTVIGNAVNRLRFSPAGGNCREELGINNLDKVILFIGKISERKNFSLVLEALACLDKNFKLLSIGTPDDTYFHNMKEFAKSKKLTERWIHLGYIPYLDLNKYVNSADIFILPSTYEGLPKVLLEASSCGLNCLYSGFDLPHPLINATKLKSLEVTEIVKEIKTLSHSPKSITNENLDKYYSWEIIAKTTTEV